MEVIQVLPERKKSDIVAVLARNLPQASGSARFDWLYLDNPDGAALVWMMVDDDGAPVGTSAAIPRQFVVDDKVVRGVILSDFAIDGAYRSLGPALKLQRATLASVLQGEFALSLDYPSRSMQAIYLRLGAQSLGSEHRYVRMISVRDKVAERIGRGVLPVLASRFIDLSIRFRDAATAFASRDISVAVHNGGLDEAFSNLSSASLKSRRAFVYRHSEYLRWRFDAHPERDYVTMTAMRAGRLAGYLIYDHAPDGNITIDELIHEPGDESVCRALLNGVVQTVRAEQGNRVQIAVLENSPLEGILSRSSFSRRESNVGPYAVVREDDACRMAIMDNENWWLGAGDRDG